MSFKEIKVTKWLFSVMFFVMLASTSLMAQSSTQINIVGVPPVLTSPFSDDIETNFKTGQYQVIFNYSSFNNLPVDFVFNFVLLQNNRPIVDITSTPRAFTPGSYVFSSFFEENEFRETPNDVIAALDKKLQNQVIQSGAIPEGNYSIEITARPFSQQTGIMPVPGRSIFSVRYPPPPILVSVPDGANLMFEAPTFSWTPVVSSTGGMFEYEFLLVEVNKGQSPLQAINSNREHASATLTGQTTLPYTLEYLPLEEGVTYAWQVKARDAMGNAPLQNEGESEISTFTFRDKGSMDQIRERISALEQIILVPGFAELSNFGQLDVEETRTSYILYGNAELDLDFANLDEVTLIANLQGVEIQKTNLQNPILMGGSLQANAEGLEKLTGELSEYVRFDGVRWEFGPGFSADLTIRTPEDSFVKTAGNMTIDRTGLRGQVRAEGSPLASFGTQPIQLELTEISASFPEYQIRTKTETTFFGESICDVSDARLSGDKFSMYINCDAEKTMPLVDYSENLVLNINEVKGQISGSWTELNLDYDLIVESDIDLNLTDERQCGASTRLNFSSEDGFSVDEINPNCSIPRPAIDLGFLHTTIENLSFGEIGLSDGGEDFDFEIEFDTQLFFPTNPDLSLPKLEGITISRDGITFPEIAFSRDELPVNNTFSMGDFDLELERFDLDLFTFPWFDWDGDGPGPWEFEFDAGLTLPFNADVPGCFSATELEILNASVSSDGEGRTAVLGAVASSDIGSCSWDIGPGFSLDVNGVEGQIALIKDQDNFTVESDFAVDADLFIDTPFSCGSDPVIELEDFLFSLDGGMNGEISGLNPDCPIEVGPYMAQITEGTLIFEHNEEDGQMARLQAAADLELSDDQSATGSFTLDLRTGEFTDIDFQLQGPFDWGIPKENPVLMFTLNEASISNEGLFIDGRQTFNLGDEEIGTTFDGLLINWDTYEILGGRIIFDQGFSFLAGIDAENSGLTFQSATNDSTLNISPGVLMELAGTVQIDSVGVRTSGEAMASILYEDLELEDLRVEYSDDFAVELQPFNIVNGRVDFFWNEQRIAYGDNSGFYPDISFFAEEFLPERIPLPSEEIAYLEIREGEEEELVVNTSRQTDGTYLIETLEGQSLNLVLPILQQPGEPLPPSIEVILDDLIVNPSTGRYISGGVYASVNGEHPLKDRPNLPIELEQIYFASAENGAGQQIKALFLSGSLKLFEQTLGETQAINLYIQNDGILRGGFSLPDANVEIPLDGPGGRVVVAADSIAGTFNWNTKNTNLSTFDIGIQGGFQINDTDGTQLVRSDIGISYNQHDFSITGFDPSSLIDAVPLDFGFFNVEIPKIESLSLSYNEQTGFDYYAELDFLFEINLDEGAIPFPLQNVEIRSDLGFVIPNQNIHEDSVPGLDLPSIDFGVFNLKPLALRMSRDTLNWNEFSPGDLVDLIPSIDFELTFPDFQESVPALANQSITLLDASFTEGIFSGELFPLDLSETPIFFPLGSGAGINISQISGELFSEDGEQQFAVGFDGSFEMPEYFIGESGECPLPEVSVNLTRSSAVEGSISSFTPCGNIELGPIELAFGESGLTFFAEEDEQEITLSGNASASVLTESGTVVEAGGDIVFDVLNGRILDGSIQISNEFPWHYPSTDSLFTFQVQTAGLTSDGLVFSGNGSVNIGDGSAGVDFQNMTFDLVNLALVDGSAIISNQFAFDVGLGPARWSVSDPSQAPEFDQGVRMTVPENVVIDSNGLTVSGSSGARLYFGEETFDALQVDFVDTRFRFDPAVGVAEGRADFILQEDGAEPERLGWYDAEGFHADNLVAAVPLPDTLALPSNDIAYLVLRDEQGNNLVQSESVAEGLSLSTSQPLELVLTAFEDGNGDPYTVSADFENIVINAAYEMISGTITIDLEDSPLNLADETNFPLGLTQLQYRREDGQNHFYTNARVVLPGELNDLEIDLDDIKLGPDGFSDITVALGEYSEQYNSENETVVVHREFADGAFAVTIRGLEFSFGSEPSYKISGDISSALIRTNDTDEDEEGEDDEEENPTLHIAGSYESSNWNFTASAEHLSGELPVGSAALILDDIGVNITEEHFAVLIDARFKVPEILGDDTQIGIEGLSIGTAGISLEQINTSAFEGQVLSLFGQEDNLTIESLGLELTDQYHLIAELNGEFNFLDRDITISGLRIGSDGTFELADGSVNLLTEQIELLGENLILTTVQLGVSDGKAQLTALADLTLPEPVETDSEVGFIVDQYGGIELINPVIDFTGVSAGIEGIGSINLHQAHFELNSITNPDFAFYAMADVTFDSGSNGKIEFGEVDNVDQWGIRYQYGGNLEWRISNNPEFSFENEMLNFTISTGQVAELPDNEFGISLGVDAGLNVSGVEGSIQFEGMVITTAGIYSLGTFENADLNVGPVNMSLTSFEYSPNGGSLELEQAASEDASADNVESEIITVQTLTHLKFGGEMTLDGVFSGGVEEFIFYRTEEETLLSIVNFNASVKDLITLNASLEYQTESNSNDFRFLVAGSAEYSPPEGESFGFAAMGRVERQNDEFSFAIYMSADFEAPIIPGIITLNGMGAGFFYNGSGKDFDTVLATSGYEMSNPLKPWEEEEEGYSFAIVISAEVGLIGTAGNYIIDGETFLMITPQWLALDVSANLYNGTPGEINVGMYLAVQWDPNVEITGGVIASVDNDIAVGSFDLHFQVVKNDGDINWALNGGINNLTILNAIDFNGNLIAGPNGFYFDLSVNAALDVKLITASLDIYLEVWWVRDQQFGAFAEFSASLSMFKGAFQGEGDFTGALIIDNGYLVYATARVSVDILFVFEGEVTGYVAVRNGNISAGRNGSDEFDDLIAEARDQAQQMNAALNDALAAAQEFDDAIQVNSIDESVIAQAGEAILSNDIFRMVVYGIMILQEEELTGTAPQLFQQIKDAMVEIDEIPSRSDYNLNNLRAQMNESLDGLAQAVNDMYEVLDEIESDAIQWEELAQQSLDEIVQNPVELVRLEWVGSGAGAIPPTFEIDENIDNANRSALESFKAEVDQLDAQFIEAIETISGNIEKLEVAMSPAGADVNGMAEQFASTVEDMEKFYANYGSLYWDINRWAATSKSIFDQIDVDMEQAVIDAASEMLQSEGIVMNYNLSNVSQSNYSFVNSISGITNYESAPQNLRVTVSNTMKNAIDFEALTKIAAYRESMIYHFAGEAQFMTQVNTAEDEFSNYVDSSQFREYFTQWTERAREFWYQLPISGYESLENSSTESGEEVYNMYEDNQAGLPPLISAHEDLTNRIDDIFSIQHSIHATYEEVLRQYVTWREDIYGEGAAEEYAVMRDQIQTKSLPPTITNISAVNDRNNYVNEYTISWNATHPSGEVVENSYYLSTDDYSTGVFRDEFLSVGSASEVTRYLFKRQIDEASRNLSIRVRARGPSGISIRRLATRSVTLNPPPISYSNNFIRYIPDNLSVIDLTGGGRVDPVLPEKPVIEFPYRSKTVYNKGAWGLSIPIGENYWSNDETTLTFSAWSMDEVNDVSAFEFRIGTENSPASIMDWTQQTGVPVNGSASNHQQYVVMGLNLEAGVNYYVSVRAISGIGEKSVVSTRGPIRIDNTAPTEPGMRQQPIVMPSVSKPGSGDTFNAATSTAVSTREKYTLPEKATPKVTLKWNNSQGGLSGMYQYHIAVTTSSDPGIGFTEGEIYTKSSGGSFQTRTIEGGILNFDDEFYFHIRGEDYAGNMGEPITLGPVQIKDPTAPLPPEIIARADGSKIGFYLKKGALDRETGVDYYAYQFINANTGAPIQGASGTVDPSSGSTTSTARDRKDSGSGSPFGGSGGSSKSDPPSYIQLPTTNVPKGVPLRIRVVAVNGQGDSSYNADSEIIIYDNTPPVEPAMTATQSGDYLNIEVSNIYDPQSGVRSAEYRIINTNGGVVKPWADLKSFSGIRYNSQTANKSWNYGDRLIYQLIVEVRIRNGNGLDRLATVTPEPEYIPPIDYAVQSNTVYLNTDIQQSYNNTYNFESSGTSTPFGGRTGGFVW